MGTPDYNEFQTGHFAWYVTPVNTVVTPLFVTPTSNTIPAITENDFAYEDTNFTVADSPRILNVQTDLHRVAHDGYIINDGIGDISFELSNDGITYGGKHTLKKEFIDFTGRTISKIRLTWIADCGYRILVV